MANEKNNLANGMDLGELGMIRNILMGQQISEWEAKYAEINQDLDEKVQHLEDLISQQGESADKEMSSIDKAISSRLDKLEKNMSKKFEQLENKLLDTAQKDRHKMGKMLSEMGRKLMES